jgi:hypothetical protein
MITILPWLLLGFGVLVALLLVLVIVCVYVLANHVFSEHHPKNREEWKLK